MPEAGLFHQQHTENFYHLFTEIAPTVHYILCKYLGRCSYQVRACMSALRVDTEDDDG